MTYRTFINYNYIVSSGNYFKVIVEVSNANKPNMNGFFSVILNPRNMKTQIGKMVYGTPVDYKTRKRNIFGVKFNHCLEVFETILNDYDSAIGQKAVSILRVNAEYLKPCFNELKRSFLAYQKADKSLQFEDCLAIGDYIDKLCKNFDDVINNTYKQVIAETPVIESEPVQEEVAENVRKTIKMAKMKNADGLTEFINGNFYPIIGLEEFNNTTYFTLLADNGEMRKVNKNRVEPLYVYAEPPINEPETAL